MMRYEILKNARPTVINIQGKKQNKKQKKSQINKNVSYIRYTHRTLMCARNCLLFSFG